MSTLKGLAQAKIIKKSVILFRVLNMTILTGPTKMSEISENPVVYTKIIKGPYTG